MKKRVAIVGAGPCGLAALKETVAGGHEAILFEQSSALGGVVASTRVYPNLHLTISNWAMAFSDFPDEERLCYPTAEHYLHYLRRYASHFDLERYIKFNSVVKSAALGNDGRWIIQVHEQGLAREEHLFDALIVATGANQVPKAVPPELSSFKGRIIHSAEYGEAFKHEVEKRKLRVLVVGGGESGADISAELGELSPDVSVWLRRAMCIGPRYLNNKSEVNQLEMNKKQDFPANGFLEAATTSRLGAAQNVYVYGFWRRILFYTPVLNKTLSGNNLDATAGAFLSTDQATYVTKNQRMCEAIDEQKIKVIITPEIASQAKVVKFYMPNGRLQELTFDTIVLCTGFTTAFPWLKIDDFDTNPRSWWLHCFPPGFGDKLFFVGYARPHQGGIPVMAEMLSRYISMLLSDERRLPQDYAGLAEQDKSAEREYYHLSTQLNSLVDYNAFLESIARRIGCEPRLPMSCILAFNAHLFSVGLFTLSLLHAGMSPLSFPSAIAAMFLSTVPFFVLQHGLLIKWWFYPHWSAWYRQRGPEANPVLLHSTLARVNIWKATAITRGFLLLLLWSIPTLYIQQLLSIPVFLAYKAFQLAGLPFGKSWGGLLRPKMFALHGTEWRWQDLLMP